jgi:microcompartment protein CcmK/EutM
MSQIVTKFISATGSTSGQVLTSNGPTAVPSWQTPSISLTSEVTGVLPIANGGTDNGSLPVTAGGVIYTDGTKFQNVGAGTSGQVLTSNGSSAPSWATNTPSFSGLTTNGVIYATSSTTVGSTSAGTSGYVLTSNGSGSAPTFQAPGSSPTSSYWSGYFARTDQWQVTTSSFGALTYDGSGGPALTQRQGTITVTAAGSSQPGITFTPASSSSVYIITVGLIGGTNGSGDDLAFQLTDGTTTITTSTTRIYGSYSDDQPWISMSGIYVPGTSSPVTVNIQGATNGTGYINNSIASAEAASIEWTLLQIM